ncbi:MAG TPA: GNAT family N-acetyltransferase [Candidatus Saccharimonadaceae bacterium]|nr:GNAT family N-acetyltransferase [Candidatus Saccharimonadaceae bacterium]
MSALVIEDAAGADAAAIADVRNAAAEWLTRAFGRGHWSLECTAAGVARGLTGSRVLVAREDGRVIGTLRLAAKKPWAIDARAFTSVERALYLLDMAVAPERQRSGVGRRLLEAADGAARAWPAASIRLDAYDAPAGAGPFYARCGYREIGRAVYRGVPLLYFERRL